MDDQNKKNPYDDFFSKDADNNRTNSENENHISPEQKQQSHYYSYGPFKSGAPEEPAREQFQSGGNEPIDNPYGAASDSEAYTGNDPNVLISPPRQVRPFAPIGQAPNDGWHTKEKKKKGGTSFKSMFASFMVGVLVIGGLMATSDYYNWFTGGKTQTASVGTKAGTTGIASTASDVIRPNNISQISENSSPAVVLIETYVKQSNYSNGSNSMFNDPFFQQFFGDQYGGRGGSNGGDGGNGSGDGSGSGQLQELGIGSGFFFQSDGYILTNQHVVEGSDQIKVKVQGYDAPLTAKLMGTAKDLDLAVLKVENPNGKAFPTLALGDSDAAAMGDWVVAIGNPNGFDHTVTVGVVSAKDREISIPDETDGTTRKYQNLLQTDASINPGNSGGPLINMKGEVIGINTAISSSSQGIGFAIPTSTIKEVVDKMKNNENVTTPSPFIGATLADITAAMVQQLGISSTDGAIVKEVYYKSPAYLADLRPYDVITGIDGKAYKTKEELIAAIQKKSVGDEITLNVVRNGAKMSMKVTIGNRNDFNNQN